MKRIAAYDTGEGMLVVAVSDLPVVNPAIDTLVKDYSNGFDEEWFVGREHINLRMRYDYGEVVDRPTEDNPHSELPDFRRFWAPRRRRQNRP